MKDISLVKITVKSRTVVQLSDMCHVHLDHLLPIYMGFSLAPNSSFYCLIIRFRLQVFLLVAIKLASCENSDIAE